jgi:hypothetical protein
MGYTSRNLNTTPKLNMRLLFKKQYGEGRMKYPLLGPQGPDEFNTFALRGNIRDAWVTEYYGFGKATYIGDEWAKRTQFAMGQPASRGTFAHVYLNGIYWGLYNPIERIRASWLSELFGGPVREGIPIYCHPQNGSSIKDTVQHVKAIVDTGQKVLKLDPWQPKHEEESNGYLSGKLSAEELQGTLAAGWMGFTDLNHDDAFDAKDWAYFKAAMTSTNGVLAIKLGGAGDMTEQNVAWTYHRAVPQLPSPLIYEGVLYMINDGGIVTSFDPTTGEVLAQGRLRGAVDAYYASPVAADGKIYFASELGLVAVVEPGGGLDVVSVGDLDDLVYGTPAIDDSRIYLRTRNTLYCFGFQ